MLTTLIRELVDSGVHFGHRVSWWNPKMAPYIYGKRNGIHIINVKETVKGLLVARKFVSQAVSQGQDVLFVGTKRQAKQAIKEQAGRCSMPYVNERWLGGTLTNFRTIRSRLARLEELEALEESGQINSYSKKMITTLTREKRKIKRNLEGIRKMSKLPGAVVVIDCRREYLALRESRKLGITTVGLIDTNSDPDTVDIAIPGNDDAMRTIELLLKELTESVEEGKASKPSEEGKAVRRPSSRRPTTARASGSGPTKLDSEEQEEVADGASKGTTASQEQA
ncbi:MAG: 30S ribosomal protein S2 [Phycisphaerae bacterium]|nr:30S ribosomal protein S2 [Phycisphaerae bacterium]